MASVTHGLGGKIALVHALCAILARRSAVFVDALGLALTAAHTGAAGAKRSRADNRCHDGSESKRNPTMVVATLRRGFQLRKLMPCDGVGRCVCLVEMTDVAPVA